MELGIHFYNLQLHTYRPNEQDIAANNNNNNNDTEETRLNPKHTLVRESEPKAKHIVRYARNIRAKNIEIEDIFFLNFLRCLLSKASIVAVVHILSRQWKNDSRFSDNNKKDCVKTGQPQSAQSVHRYHISSSQHPEFQY